MVKTPRINLFKDLNFIIPIIIGIVLFVYTSVIIATFISRKNEDYIRVQIVKRDAMVSEYESYQSEFNTLLSDVLALNIQNIPVNYDYSLSQFENVNTIMKSLAKDIHQASTNAKSDTEEVDSIRLQNHITYADLITSLESYLSYITDEKNIRNCFDKINLNKSDSIIVTNIGTCSSSLDQFRNEYSSLPSSTKNYWNAYQGYWNTVKSIHSNPPKSQVTKLQNDLKTTYASVNKLNESYVKSLEYFYKDNVLINIKKIK